MNGAKTGDQHRDRFDKRIDEKMDERLGNLVGQRMIALETADSYQQRAIDESDAQIYQLAQKVDRLEKIVATMSEKVKEMAQEKQPSLPENERPPHY